MKLLWLTWEWFIGKYTKNILMYVNMSFILAQHQRYTEALQWYNFSLSLCSSTEQHEPSSAKLHRNRASCHIGLDQLEQASLNFTGLDA